MNETPGFTLDRHKTQTRFYTMDRQITQTRFYTMDRQITQTSFTLNRHKSNKGRRDENSLSGSMIIQFSVAIIFERIPVFN